MGCNMSDEDYRSNPNAMARLKVCAAVAHIDDDFARCTLICEGVKVWLDAMSPDEIEQIRILITAALVAAGPTLVQGEPVPTNEQEACVSTSPPPTRRTSAAACAMASCRCRAC